MTAYPSASTVKVAALFVDPKGVYSGLDDVEVGVYDLCGL